MKNRLEMLLIKAIILLVLVLPLFCTAYTYGNSRSSGSGDSSWIFIPLIICVVGFAATIIFQRLKANKEAGNDNIRISSIIEEKLLPEEKAIRKINNGRSEFIATDKRLLRFSSRGFESIDYTDISAVEYTISTSKQLFIRLVLAFCVLGLVALTVGIWASAFDSSTRNVSVTDALIITVVCGVIGYVGYLAAKHDYGYYQIQSEIYEKSDKKLWRFIRIPLLGNNPNVEKFVETIKEYIPK